MPSEPLKPYTPEELEAFIVSINSRGDNWREGFLKSDAESVARLFATARRSSSGEGLRDEQGELHFAGEVRRILGLTYEEAIAEVRDRYSFYTHVATNARHRLIVNEAALSRAAAPVEAVEPHLCFPFSITTCDRPDCTCREEKRAASDSRSQQ